MVVEIVNRNQTKLDDEIIEKIPKKFNYLMEYVPSFKNEENTLHIIKQFHYCRNLKLNKASVDLIKATRKRLAGACYGSLEGIWTGMAIGGKWGGNGGWIMGAITQLLCLLVSPCLGGIHGFILGMFMDRTEIFLLINNYRKHIASTAIIESSKNF
jgi:hypothetical protein